MQSFQKSQTTDLGNQEVCETADRRPEERGLGAWSLPLIAILAILAKIVKRHPETKTHENCGFP
jgi:hypothetical protein